MTLLDVKRALERLLAAHQSGDAAELAAATEQLDELGHLELAAQALDDQQRWAIVTLAWSEFKLDLWPPDRLIPFGRYYQGCPEETFRAPERRCTGEEIGRLLGLPARVVEHVLSRQEATWERRYLGEVERWRRDSKRERRERREERAEAWALALTVACPTCGRAAGDRCRTTVKGHSKPEPHGARTALAREQRSAEEPST